MTQMPLAEDDHVIEALTSDRADQSFSIAVLPRRSRRCRSVANAHRANAARKRVAVSTVAITNEVLWRHIGVAFVPVAHVRNRQQIAARNVGSAWRCSGCPETSVESIVLVGEQVPDCL